MDAKKEISKQEMKKKLESYGIKKNNYIEYHTSILCFLSLVCFSVLTFTIDKISKAIQPSQNKLLTFDYFNYLFCNFTLPTENNDLAISSAAAITAFFIGLYQWSTQRKEISLDKFYERLDRANKHVDNWPSARHLVQSLYPNIDDPIPDIKQNEPKINVQEFNYQTARYVYTEIDNLEYVIEKYCLGFMSVRTTYRGIICFISRCQDIEFINLAIKLAEKAGYNATTEDILKNIRNEIHGEQPHQKGQDSDSPPSQHRRTTTCSGCGWPGDSDSPPS